MTSEFPIIRRPARGERLPVLVSIPHYGTTPIPGVHAVDYADPGFATLPHGYADAFAAELYGDLHRVGATVIATPFSRLFVDVNRRRDDFDVDGDQVRSHRGVIRTHTVRGRPIYARPLTTQRAERLLASFYDPYHRALRDLVAEGLERHPRLLVLDAHTGSQNGMRDHQVIIGTKRGATSHPALGARSAEIFAASGFEPHHDVPGYAGGHIVRRYGKARRAAVHAVQIEVNAGLLMAGSRQAYFAEIARGETPRSNPATVPRLRACVREIVRALPGLLARID